MVLIAAEAVNCLVLPCASLPVAANRFRQTRWGAYGEATINILLSLILIRWQPLLGVAIGTLVATLFRGIFYTVYSAKHILGIPSRRLIVDYAIALGLLVTVVIGGNAMLKMAAIDNYMQWFICGGIVFLILAIPTALIIKRILAQPAE
jgi:O-antigen/teichoic acid export membrane protein